MTQHNAGKKKNFFAPNLGIKWLEKKQQLCGQHQQYSRRLTGKKWEIMQKVDSINNIQEGLQEKMGNNAKMMTPKWFNWEFNDVSHSWWESMSH